MRPVVIEKKDWKQTLSVLHSWGHKPPAQLTFAHLACCLFLNEPYLLDPDHMTGISGLHRINPARFKLRCVVCRVPGGAGVQCAEKKCCAGMHMQCALEHGYQIEIQPSTQGDTKYFVWCDKHRTTPRKATALHAAASQGQVSGGAASTAAPPQCQVCCYNVKPLPIDGVPNDMLACTGCQLQVHRWCYGDISALRPGAASQTDANGNAAIANGTAVASVSDSAAAAAASSPSSSSVANGCTPFLCRVCESVEKRKAAGLADDGAPPAECALCLSMSGALKPTVDGRWVCLPCVYFNPELFFTNPAAFELIAGVENAEKARRKLACALCDRTNGTPVQCFNLRCATAYHVSCAYASGWQFCENPKDPNGQCPFVSYCGVHSRAGAPSLASNPLFADATFTPFTLEQLPGDDTTDGGPRRELIDLTASSATTGTAAAAARNNNSSSSMMMNGAGSKRSRAISLTDSESDADYDDGGGSKASRVGGGSASKRDRSKRGSDGGMSMSSGVGQLVFEPFKKKGDAAASGASSGKKGSSSTPPARPPRDPNAPRLRKYIFLLDSVPAHIQLVYVDGRTGAVLPNQKAFFINSEADAAAIAAKSGGGVPNRKRKHGRASQSRSHTATIKEEGVEDLEEDNNAAAAADGAAAATMMTDTAAAATASADAANGDSNTPKRHAKRRRVAATAAAAALAAPVPAAATTSRVPVSSSGSTSRMPRAAASAASTLFAKGMGGSDDSDDDESDSVAAEGEELHCVCRKPWRSTDASMVGCDGCGLWCHWPCVGLTVEDYNRMQADENEKFYCPTCAKDA
jgi:hypothetical protein